MKVLYIFLVAVLLSSCMSERAAKVRIAKKIQSNSDVFPLLTQYPDYNLSTFNIYQDIETENFIDPLGTHGYMYPKLAKLEVQSTYITPDNSEGTLYKVLRRRPLIICRADIMSFSIPDSLAYQADSLLTYYKTEIERGASIYDLGRASYEQRRTFSADNIWFSQTQMGEKFMDALREHNKGDVYIYYHKPESSYGKYMVIRKTSEATLVSETNVLKIDKYLEDMPLH
jgi:hypothetical protein